MISRLIGGFVAILIGSSLIDPLSNEVQKATISTENLSANTPWGATVLNLVPGFYALGILGIGVAITYGALRDAGIL